LLGRIRSRLTYANVMSTLAVFGVLGGGTALASYVITSNSQVGPDTISGHNPASGDHSNVISGSIDTADLAAGAVSTGKLAGGSVDTPKFAADATAPNAAQLGGDPPSVYQRRITRTCGTRGRAITSVNPFGGVECSPRVVMPIAADPTPSQNAATNLSPSDLGLIENCGGQTNIRFFNNGSQAGTLNWMFSEGGTTSTVNATGNVLAPYPASIDFNYAGRRLEGQWIFSGGGAVTTVNLHAFDGGTSCEVRGTAEWAAVP
jgi:hypothetical protein